MKITKVRDVKTPTRGTNGSAGIDFYVPNDFLVDTTCINNQFFIAPGQDVNIKSGIIMDVPTGTVFIAFNKSGVAIKKGLQVGACVIDEDYQGEIHIHLRNISKEMVAISPGEKIVQFILIPVIYEDVEEVKIEDLFETVTERGSGAFGSTGTA